MKWRGGGIWCLEVEKLITNLGTWAKQFMCRVNLVVPLVVAWWTNVSVLSYRSHPLTREKKTNLKKKTYSILTFADKHNFFHLLHIIFYNILQLLYALLDGVTSRLVKIPPSSPDNGYQPMIHSGCWSKLFLVKLFNYGWGCEL